MNWLLIVAIVSPGGNYNLEKIPAASYAVCVKLAQPFLEQNEVLESQYAIKVGMPVCVNIYSGEIKAGPWYKSCEDINKQNDSCNKWSPWKQTEGDK